jgi:hypothetical protein
MRFKIHGFWSIILLFAIIKVSIHLLTSTNYELHSDAFLYLAQGDHLDWGYLSVPPLTAFLSKILRIVTGDSTFAVRIFPALIGGFSVIFVNLIVRELGGKKWAMVLASIAFIIAPAFLRSNMLFQPVSLNQFFWLTSFYLIIRLVNSQDPRYWLYLSVNFGLGFLAKYSIVFLATGFLIALLLTPDRRLIWSKYFLYGILIGFLIILPNLIWQYQNNWPVLYHIGMLREYHLVNVKMSDFIIAQFLMNLPVVFIWLTGLFYFLIHPDLIKHRIIALIYLAVIFMMILTQGKSYYTIGLYSTLFAAGAVVFERYLNRKVLVILNLSFMIIISLVMFPFSLPVLGHQKMIAFCKGAIDKGIDMPMKWEDGEVHALPQDYADMIGWEELGARVIKVYLSLPPELQKNCYIYGGNYGQAGAIRYHSIRKGLPEPICFHGSFVFWAPENIDNINHLIYVDYEIDHLLDYFEEVDMIEGITNPYSREKGLKIYSCRNPNKDFKAFYKNRLQAANKIFLRNP